jgi:hypothetical protein
MYSGVFAELDAGYMPEITMLATWLVITLLVTR